MEHRWQARYVYCAIVVTRQVNIMIKKTIPIISNAKKKWGSKSVFCKLSYYTVYAFLAIIIIIIIIIIIVFQRKKHQL